jgi:hypothetical protein
MTDRAFSGRWLGALDMTLRVYLEIHGRLERLKTVGAVREVLPVVGPYAHERMRDAFVEGRHAGARQAWRLAEADGRAPEWPLESIDEERVGELSDLAGSVLPEILDGLERKEATDALTYWRGFEAFCDERMGLDAAKVLRVVLEPGAGRIQELEDLAKRLGLEPDAETVEEMREGLAEAWRMVEARGG